jgi:hypothetical protein
MLIRNLIDYVKTKRIIKDVIKEEDLLNNLSSLFSKGDYRVKFKQDWIGRIYAVVNPVVQDPQSRIFEFGEEGVNIKSFVHKWVMDHMIAADTFIKNHELFDILIYNIEQLDDNYNFLFTLTPIAWYDFWKSLKRFFWISLSIIVLAIVALIIFL